MNKFTKLSDGGQIPTIGLGVYKVDSSKCINAVKSSLEVGYRHVDTAEIYGNEQQVGEAVKDFLSTGVCKRSDLFITTKVWNDSQGKKTAKALSKSLQKLQLDYVDLYLIHSPVKATRLQTWKEMQKLKQQGLIKHIGVSNYSINHLQELINDGVDPKEIAVNQIELHPWLQRKESVAFCKKHGIVIEAYSPLTKGIHLKDDRLIKMAKKYSKTPAQILIRWCIDMGTIPLPKSVSKTRIDENYDVWDFSLSVEDLKEMESWDEGKVTGWNPLEWA